MRKIKSSNSTVSVHVIKQIVQVFAIFICLPTQQCLAEPADKPFEFGFGTKIALAREWFMDLAGGVEHYAPSIGANIHGRYNIESINKAIRGKISYENFGDRRLGGTTDHRCEVKRSMVVLGLIMFSPRPGRPGYLCVESGLVHWDIKSTYAPLDNIKMNKNVTSFIVGAETKNLYFELGFEYFGFVKNRIVSEDNFIRQINNTGYCIVNSVGVKF